MLEGGVRGRLRRRPLARCAAQIGIERGGSDFDQLMVLAVLRSRELHEKLERFPPRSTYRVLHPDLKGYWQFFGRVDVGEGLFFHAPVPADTTRDNYDFHGLLQKAAGIDVRLRVRLCRVLGPAHRGRREVPGRPRLHRRRRRAQPSALRRLRPQQRARRRGQSRLEARRAAQGLGQRRAARHPTARSGGRSSRRPPRSSSRPASSATGSSWSATAPSATGPSSSAPGRSTPSAAAPRVDDLRAALRGLVDRVRAAGRREQRPRHAHVQGAGRASPAAAAALSADATCSRSWAGTSPCWRSTRRTARSRRSSRRRAALERAAEDRARQLSRTGARPTRRGSSWCGRTATSPGSATARPADAGAIMRKVTGRA